MDVRVTNQINNKSPLDRYHYKINFSDGTEYSDCDYNISPEDIRKTCEMSMKDIDYITIWDDEGNEF